MPKTNFDTYLKKKFMLEYSVPFAIHLLSFRHETQSAGGIVAGMPRSKPWLQQINRVGGRCRGWVDDFANQTNVC